MEGDGGLQVIIGESGYLDEGKSYLQMGSQRHSTLASAFTE